MGREKAKLFFEKFIGKQADDFVLLAQSGSARQNFIGQSGHRKYVITTNENLAENESFFYFSAVFSDLNLNTPEIFKISDDRKMYVQEFLGTQTLSEIIAEEGINGRTESLVTQTLTKLFALQTKTENLIDYSKTFEYEKYDHLPITNDLFYFKSFIADVLEIPYHKSTLLKEFRNLTEQLENLQPKGLMIRDFQARNIMVNDADEVFFIDYQSAMEGPLMYDVVSFLFQAKANFTEDFKTEMLHYYYSLWTDGKKISELKSSLKLIQLIRYLQVLGAYGFRGLIQKKEHFLSSLSGGIENLYSFSQNWQQVSDFPELHKLIAELKSDAVREKITKITLNKSTD